MFFTFSFCFIKFCLIFSFLFLVESKNNCLIFGRLPPGIEDVNHKPLPTVNGTCQTWYYFNKKSHVFHKSNVVFENYPTFIDGDFNQPWILDGILKKDQQFNVITIDFSTLKFVTNLTMFLMQTNLHLTPMTGIMWIPEESGIVMIDTKQSFQKIYPNLNDTQLYEIIHEYQRNQTGEKIISIAKSIGYHIIGRQKCPFTKPTRLSPCNLCFFAISTS